MNPTQPYVQTVRGPIDPSELGQTLMHEHLVADWAYGTGRKPQLTSVDVVPKVVDCLDEAQKVGVGTIVDVSTEGFALSPLLVKLAAENTSVNIVAATGCYKPLAMPLPRWAYPPAEPEDIAEHIIAVARDGLQGTGIKPGIIKVATDAGKPMHPVVATIFRGAAIAQRATGLAITTHTSSPACAEAHVDVLGEAGADMERVVIGHAGLRSGAGGFPLFERLAKLGVGVGFDNFGILRPDEEWAEMTVRMIEAGYTKNVILSHDMTVFSRGMEGIYEKKTLKDPNYVDLPSPDKIPKSLVEGDFTLIHSRLLPLLKKAGVSDETISEILVENPRRILTIDPGRYS
jgi:phosphotriesterase-related protein